MANGKKNAWKTWNGFAIEIKEDTELDGILMLEERISFETTLTRPVAAVVSVNEAREIAASRKNTESCRYRLWARGIEGEYIPVPHEILVVKK